MNVQLLLTREPGKSDHRVILIDKNTRLSAAGLGENDAKAAQKFFEDKVNNVYHKILEDKTLSIVKIDTGKPEFKIMEEARIAGYTLNRFLNAQKIKEVAVF